MKRNFLSPIFAALFLSLSLSSFSFAEGQGRAPSMGKPADDKPLRNLAADLAFAESGLTSSFASWGINPSLKESHINLKDAWEKFSKKKDIVVAVVDTGIDPEHPFLKENIYFPSSKNPSTQYGMDFSQKGVTSLAPLDDHGHGTHVSGIIKSIFPDVKILALKYYNPKGSGPDNLVATIQALEYAVNHNVDIINYSGGGPEASPDELRVLKLAEQKGILVVAAAGNESSNIDEKKNAYFPASYGLSNIITVTAHDQNLEILPSSNWGKISVDISAPGERIRSSVPVGKAGYMTGTSQATAFVTGVAALLKAQDPGLSVSDMKKILIASAKKEKTLTEKCASGGRLDAKAALEMIDQAGERKLAVGK